MPIEEVTRQKGKVYRARFTVNNTPFKSPWFPLKEDAKQWEARQRVEVADGRSITGSSLTFSDFAKLWLERHADVHKAFTTALRDRQYLNKYMLPRYGSKKLRSLTADFTPFRMAISLHSGNPFQLIPDACFSHSGW